MPRYEVRRLGVLTHTVVEARNETEARTKARDIFAQEAMLAALTALVQPFPPDDTGDARSEARYEETEADRETERLKGLRMGLFATESDSDGLEPW